MKELTLQEIQHRLLDCLCSIDQCCRDNNIQYSLAYGSLLGAVRHHGFIPWDDDVDIMMTRDNLKVFLSCFSDNNYDVISSNTKGWGAQLVRICDRGTILKWNDISYEKRLEHGLWIAIFPIDNVPDDISEWKKMDIKIKLLAKCIGQKKGMWAPTGFFRNILKAFVRFALSPFTIPYLSRLQEKCQTKFNSQKTQKTFHLNPFGWCFLDREITESYIDLKFEGKHFMVIKDYDKFLKQEYGDYMTPPPENKRVPKHEYSAYIVDYR